MIVRRRWWLMVSLGLQMGAIAGVAGAQERAPRFLSATRTGLVPLNIERTPALMRRLTTTITNASVHEALTAISAESGVRFSYVVSDLPASRRVQLEAHRLTVAAALTEVLIGTGLDVVLDRDGNLLLAKPGGTPLVVVQQRATGILTGRVTERGTNAPIVSAAVTVVGKGLTRLTDDKGQYRIVNVPEGEQEVTVRRLGFEPALRHIRVSGDETVTADFAMAHVPTALTEVVTTATGERSRLEVGNAIGTIKADSIVPTTLIRNMSDLLTARTPGVVVSGTNGMIGAPSIIRIRGVGSMNLNNDPIVILDGVRILALTTRTETATDQMNAGDVVVAASVNGASSAGNIVAPSRLDDIDPTMIESIDVLRGPSAATLYGTEAANGVIVIKTKRGKAGPFRFDLSADAGALYVPSTVAPQWFGWGTATNGSIYTVGRSGAVGGVSGNCFLAADFGNGGGNAVTEGTCHQDSVTSFNPANDPQMRTLIPGTSHNLSGSLSGGSDQLREYLSLRFSENLGNARLSAVESRRIATMWGVSPPSWIMKPNTDVNINGSSRTSAHLSPTMDVSLGVNVVYRNTLLGSSGLVASGVTSPRDTLIYLPAEQQQTRLSNLAKRGILSLAGNYTPLSWLTLTGTVGGDYTLRTDDALLRASDCTVILNPTGCPSGHGDQRGETFVTTVNVGAQAVFPLGAGLTSRTSIGEQYTDTKFYALSAGNGTNTTLAFGTELLSPSPVAASGTPQLVTVTESRDESATAGWYAEESVGVRERLFLTAAVRADVASAFGRSINQRGIPIYPKFGVSWLLSEEPFFPTTSYLSSLRVRAAYGQSGTQAGQTDVLGNFGRVNVDGGAGTVVAGVVRSALSNTQLRPERSGEWEGGMDLSLLGNERLRIEATIYRKLTIDAIVANTLPLSAGVVSTVFSSSGGSTIRRENLGSVENRGTELAMSAKVVDSRRFGWEITVNYSQNANKLVNAKTETSLSLNAITSINRVGYPIKGYWGREAVSYYDLNGDGLLANREVALTENVVFFGAPYPRSEVTYVNTCTLFSGLLRITANFDQVNGVSNTLNEGVGEQYRIDPTSTLAQQAVGIEELANGSPGGFIGESSTLRFTELSATYTVPRPLARRVLGSQSISVTFAGRNLALWTTYYGGRDPNVSTSTNAYKDIRRDNGTAVPAPRDWTIRVNLGL